MTSVEKRDKGYVITINNYSAVFAYITRNELSYIEELALLFPSNTKQQASTSTQKVAPQTPTPSATASSSNATTTVIATSTTAKTKTQVNKASTSPVTSSTTITQISSPVILAQPVKPVEEISFSDITIDNQNMRVWNEGGKSVVYAFIGNSYLVIANTKEDLLALKSAILK